MEGKVGRAHPGSTLKSNCAYIFLCEVLLRGGVEWLTKKRGEKWVKELDYFYLLFGDDLAGDEPVEQHADGREVLLDGRLLEVLAEAADIGGWPAHEAECQ